MNDRLAVCYIDDSKLDRAVLKTVVWPEVCEGLPMPADLTMMSAMPGAVEDLAKFDALILDFDLRADLTGIQFAHRVRDKLPTMNIAVMSGIDRLTLINLAASTADAAICKNESSEMAGLLTMFLRRAAINKLALGRRSSHRLGPEHRAQSEKPAEPEPPAESI